MARAHKRSRSRFHDTSTGDNAVIQNFLATLTLALLTSAMGVALAASPVKLSGVMAAGGDVLTDRYAIAPGTTKRAIFVADRATDGLFELWSTPVSGGTPVKLSGTLPAGSIGVTSLKVSPDGNWVAFVTAASATLSQQLWLVANDGTAATPAAVSGPLAGISSIIQDFQWSANSLRIVFRAGRNVPGQIEVYSKPLSGAAVNLSTLPDATRAATAMQISGDSSRVVFVADRDVDNVNELYSVPITGGSVSKLSGATIATANLDSNFLISANSSRVLFVADRDTNNVFELYGNSLDGSAGLIKLSAALIDSTGVVAFRVTPDGSRVVYRASVDTLGVSEIYSASATAVGPSIKLSGALVAGGFTSSRLDLTPDGQRVVFLANKDSATLQELYSAPINAANAAVKISDPAAAGFTAFSFALCPNSACVVYLAAPTLGISKLVSTTTTAPVIAHLSAPVGLVSTGGFGTVTSAASYRAFGINITPDSRRLLWADTRNDSTRFEWFSAAIGGAASSAPVAISGSLVAGGNVLGTITVSADSTTVAFAADKDTDGVTELYAVAPDGGGAILDIDGDGVVLPTTDGLMLTRWQLGIRGAALFGGITFAAGATRTTVTAIEDHLRRLSESGLGW